MKTGWQGYTKSGKVVNVMYRGRTQMHKCMVGFRMEEGGWDKERTEISACGWHHASKKAAQECADRAARRRTREDKKVGA